jgi:hypothetical protein
MRGGEGEVFRCFGGLRLGVAVGRGLNREGAKVAKGARSRDDGVLNGKRESFSNREWTRINANEDG